MTNVYRERLTPRPVIWVVLGVFAGTVGLAYAAALGVSMGIAVGACLASLIFAVLWWTSPLLTVSATEILAGSATLPILNIGEVSILDAEEVKLARDGRHPQADARAYTLIRPWTGNTGVLLRLNDEMDPHPSWVLSSRNPIALAAAIQAVL